MSFFCFNVFRDDWVSSMTSPSTAWVLWQFKLGHAHPRCWSLVFYVNKTCSIQLKLLCGWCFGKFSPLHEWRIEQRVFLNQFFSSNNQKLERPPCGNVTAHAVVHNAHSVHAALPAHLSCNPTSRTSGVLLKKGSVRSNGDILKRSRIQTA